MNVAWLLIASAVGYWVMTLAQRQKGNTKTVGKWLGVMIIIVGLAGSACTIACVVSGKAGACPPMGKAYGSCPLTSALCAMGKSMCPTKSAACPMKSSAPAAPSQE